MENNLNPAEVTGMHDSALFEACVNSDPESAFFKAAKAELITERLYDAEDIEAEADRILERRAAEHVADLAEYHQSRAQGWCL